MPKAIKKTPVKKKHASKKPKKGTVTWLIEQLKGLPGDSEIVANCVTRCGRRTAGDIVKVTKGKLFGDGTFITPTHAKKLRKHDPELWEKYDDTTRPVAYCLLLEDEGNFGYY